MKNFLLPYYYKAIGVILVLIAIVFSVLYLKFDLNYTIPVFAIVSIYLETKFFVISQSNFIDEITLILFVLGFGLIVFSKEKNEFEFLCVLREKALVRATIVNAFIMLFSIIFIYGGGFLGILVLNLFSVFIFYLFFFYVSLKKRNQETRV